MKIQIDKPYSVEEIRDLTNNFCPVCNTYNLKLYKALAIMRVYCDHDGCNFSMTASWVIKENTHKWHSCNFDYPNDYKNDIYFYNSRLIDNNIIDMKCLYKKYLIAQMVT